MLLPDVNVLVHAVNEGSRDHDVSRAWLDRSLSGGAAVGFTWVAVLGFLRLATAPGVFAAPMAPEHAREIAQSWLDARGAHLLHPSPTHLATVASLLTAAGAGGRLTTDAHLAALALENQATVITFDSDFSRFPGVRSEAPR